MTDDGADDDINGDNVIDDDMNCVMRKPAFCTCENKDGDREADLRLCFHMCEKPVFS